MKILITAGGTSEKIDDVRKISNMATGKLGSLIADAFFAVDQESIEVIYIASNGAVIPKNNKIRTIVADDVKTLKETVELLMQEEQIDAVIHAMAVSDYTVKYCVPARALAHHIVEHLEDGNADHVDHLKDRNADNMDALSEQIQFAIKNGFTGHENTGKISSEIEHLMLCLEKAPKIIKLFKTLQPNTILVGFKLLADVPEQQLICTASKLRDKNLCDFVLANDLVHIQGNQHRAILLNESGEIKRMETKQEIADAIVHHVIKKYTSRDHK